MTHKQERFCNEYLIDCNATKAAIRAGYSKKTARYIGFNLLGKKEVKQMIDQLLKEMNDKQICTAKEVMVYLSSVVRGESESEVVAVESDTEGNKKAVKMMKHPDESQKLKAAELLAKRYGLLSDRVSFDGVVPVIITGEDDIEE